MGRDSLLCIFYAGFKYATGFCVAATVPELCCTTTTKSSNFARTFFVAYFNEKDHAVALEIAKCYYVANSVKVLKLQGKKI